MVIVGTYNMSFAGDFFPDNMPQFPSEYSFHLRHDTTAPAFWNNAKKHLEKFINDKKPLAVGLQEMNIKECHPDFPFDAEGGVRAIKNILPPDYKIVSRMVDTFNAGISIIYNSKVTGEIVRTKIVDNPNQENYNALNGGRPLLMILTTNNYLLVNMHGAQNAKLGGDIKQFNEYMIKSNKQFLETEVDSFLKSENTLRLKNSPVNPIIYIMGDFNDRYDAIKDFSINGKKVKCPENPPRSCCHNWDSMGNNESKTNIPDSDLFQGNVPTASTNYGESSGWKFTSLKSKIPLEHGITIPDYLNIGDKVFYFHPEMGTETQTLQIYDSSHNISAEDKGSKASDHELVYMEHLPNSDESVGPNSDESVGGYGIFKGKRKSRKSRKSKKTRNLTEKQRKWREIKEKRK